MNQTDLQSSGRTTVSLLVSCVGIRLTVGLAKNGRRSVRCRRQIRLKSFNTGQRLARRAGELLQRASPPTGKSAVATTSVEHQAEGEGEQVSRSWATAGDRSADGSLAGEVPKMEGCGNSAGECSHPQGGRESLTRSLGSRT